MRIDEMEKRGIDKYLDAICEICNTSPKELNNDNSETAEGCFGVAMVMAYLSGVQPDIYSLSKYLGVAPFCLEIPYDRLRINGIFGSKYNAANDRVLLGEQDKGPNQYLPSANHEFEIAWGIIAGVASGLTGVQ